MESAWSSRRLVCTGWCSACSSYSCALFAVCFRWGLGAFLFLSSHVEILTSHDARSAGSQMSHLSHDTLSSCVVKVGPRPEGSQMSHHSHDTALSLRGARCHTTLTTQQLRRESLKVKILLCRPSRHSSCVVKVCPAPSSKSSETFAGVAFQRFTAVKFAALVCFG